MKQFEYKKLFADSTQPSTLQTINEMGLEGWEMTCQTEHSFWFKREIEKPFPLNLDDINPQPDYIPPAKEVKKNSKK